MAGKSNPRGSGKNSGQRPAKTSNWVGKDMNLTAAQKKAAVRVVGTKGGKTRTEAVKASERAAARKTVSIKDTKWNTVKDRGGKGRGGLLTGADGKPVTGTVKLPNGKTASYVRGKRISVMAAKPAPSAGTRSRTGGTGGTTSKRTVTPPAKPKKPTSYGDEQRKPIRTPKPSTSSTGNSEWANSQIPKPKPKPQRPMSGGGRGAGIPTISVPMPTPKKRVATSPNKRGGETRSSRQQTIDLQRLRKIRGA